MSVDDDDNTNVAVGAPETSPPPSESVDLSEYSDKWVCLWLTWSLNFGGVIRYTRSIINKGHREMIIVVAPFSIPKIA